MQPRDTLVQADHKNKFTPSSELNRFHVPAKLGLDRIELLRSLRVSRTDTLINILLLKDSGHFLQRLALRLREEEVHQTQYNDQAPHINGEVSPPQRIERNGIDILVEETGQ